MLNKWVMWAYVCSRETTLRAVWRTGTEAVVVFMGPAFLVSMHPAMSISLFKHDARMEQNTVGEDWPAEMP